MNLNRTLAALVSLAALASAEEATGLTATYFPKPDFAGTPVTEREPNLNFNWAGAPVIGFPDDYWSATFTGTIDIPSDDTWTFTTYNDDGVILYIGDTKVLHNWTNGDFITQGSVKLTAGRYPIAVRYYENYGSAKLRLYWQTPTIPAAIVPTEAFRPAAPAPAGGGDGGGTGSGLAATYFDEAGLSGFTSTALDASLDFTWDGTAAPAASIAPDTFSVRWVGKIEAPYTDLYTFSATTDQPFTLNIAGQDVITDDGSATGLRTASGAMQLKAGQRYDVLATFRNAGAAAQLQLAWASTFLAKQVVPTGRLYPTDAAAATAVTVLSPVASYTSPAWVEGTVGHWTTAVSATLDGSPVSVVRAGAAPWYLTSATSGQPLGVTLGGPTSTLVLDSENSGATRHAEQVITWTTIDLAHRPYGLDAIDVRPGDQLRLTATGTEAAPGSELAIDLDQPTDAAFTADKTGAPGTVFTVPFGSPGVKTVVARLDGVEVGRLTVRVPSINLQAPIACGIDFQRLKDISVNPFGSAVVLAANDPTLLEVGVQAPTSNGQRLTLRPNGSGELALQARLGANGPVVATCGVDEFTLRTTAEKNISLVDVIDGNVILEANLVMSPLVRNIDVRMDVYVNGLTFDDSSLTKWVSSNAFSESGLFVYRMIRYPDGWSHACHTINAFQAGVKIMER